MSYEFNFLARDKNGFKVSLKVTGDELLKVVSQYDEAVKYANEVGWQTEMEAAAAKFAGPAPKPSAPFETPSLVCAEDGATVEGATVQGTTYTAVQLAASRAKKVDDLIAAGAILARGPRCADCWKRGGYAQRYKALRGFPS